MNIHAILINVSVKSYFYFISGKRQDYVVSMLWGDLEIVTGKTLNSQDYLVSV